MRWNSGKGVHALVALILISVSSTASAVDSPINALWNDSNGFGIWLYGRDGNCSTLEYKHPPFLVLGTGGKRPDVKDGEYSVASLQARVLIRDSGPVLCKSGYIRLQFLQPANEFVGDYDCTVSDSSKWAGKFRAQYCKAP
jgi:hypothetical protein